MRNESLKQIRQEKVAGVIKATLKRKVGFLVRVNHKGNVLTLKYFKKEKDANNYYNDYLNGNIVITNKC